MSEIDIAQRLEKLERDNRRLKRLGFAALVLVAAVGAIYATRPVPEKITAHEFEMVDSAGRARVGISMNVGVPSVWIQDERGKVRAEMSVNPFGGGPGIYLYDKEGLPQADMNIPGSVPNIWLSDRRGFELNLGGTQITNRTTGETQQTSAASIVMFGNDKQHHVIWRAP